MIALNHLMTANIWMTVTAENIFYGMYVVWIAKNMSRLLGEEEVSCIQLMVKTCFENKNVQSVKRNVSPVQTRTTFFQT